METNTLLVFPVQLSKLCLRSNVANAAKVSASRHMCGSDHRSNRAHLTLAAWTSAIWDSSMSASRRSLDGVPPIVQADVLAATRMKLAGKSLDENSAQQRPLAEPQPGASRIVPQDWAATEVTAGTD